MLKPVYPYDYSIVNEQNVKLMVSSADPFAASQEYMMEMDTTETFDSPFKISQFANYYLAVLFEFNPGITFTDSMVYYWRVAAKPDFRPAGMEQSSFQYIANGEPGFSQAHYYQHLKSSMYKNSNWSNTGKWSYMPVINNLFVANGVWGSAITQESQLVVNVNDSSYIRNTCNYGLIFNVFDKNTFKPWKNQLVTPTTGLYGSYPPNCASNKRIQF